jgi:peptidoglycan/LPS O-acetylase OafA/YrhL
MARLAVSRKSDPELLRRRRTRKRAARIARIYIALALLVALALALLALFAPWTLAAAASRVIAVAVDIFLGVADAGRSTGGFVSWSSAIYALMLLALIPVLALLRRRPRRREKT